jgi:molecular chaperone HscB
MECAACHKPAGDGLVCRSCGAILPPRKVDPFAALDVPRRFDLTDADLEARFRELSRKLHPDRFARAAPAERLRSLQAATTLNDAYRLLRKPLARAEALLALHGVTIGENESITGALLMEIMELRESLEDARAAGDAATVRSITDAVRARRDAAMAEIAALFAAAADPLEVKARVIAIRYFDRLLEAGEAHPAAEGAL